MVKFAVFFIFLICSSNFNLESRIRPKYLTELDLFNIRSPNLKVELALEHLLVKIIKLTFFLSKIALCKDPQVKDFLALSYKISTALLEFLFLSILYLIYYYTYII